MTPEDELEKAETIITEAEVLTSEATMDAAGYQEIMAGLVQTDAILRRIMNDYATGEASLSVSQIYLASDLLVRLHEAKHHLPPPPGNK